MATKTKPPPAPNPPLPAPKLTCQTFGTPTVMATADYPPGTPNDPDAATPAQHAAAFVAVLRAVISRTEDLRDVTFYYQVATADGSGWRTGTGLEWTMPDMLDYITGGKAVAS